MIESYPLYWPDNWPRTPALKRICSHFKITTGVVRNMLYREAERLGASQIIISTNVPTRNDGEFYISSREPQDPGVAVYFTYKQKPMSFACDQYRTVRENLHSIQKTIEALRGIKRWGASDMLERAFSGFAALPAIEPWREILGVSPAASLADAESAFRRKVHETHPDHGGNGDMDRLTQARDQARREFNAL